MISQMATARALTPVAMVVMVVTVVIKELYSLVMQHLLTTITATVVRSECIPRVATAATATMGTAMTFFMATAATAATVATVEVKRFISKEI